MSSKNTELEPHDRHVLNVEEYLSMLSAVGNKKRFRTLEYLTSEGEATASELADVLDVAQNTLNYHIEELMEAGLVKNWRGNQSETDQRYSYYISTSRGNVVMDTLTALFRELKTGGTQPPARSRTASSNYSTDVLAEIEELRDRVERLESQ